MTMVNFENHISLMTSLHFSGMEFTRVLIYADIRMLQQDNAISHTASETICFLRTRVAKK